jgi:Ca2+-binding RTX toxin-like protein
LGFENGVVKVYTLPATFAPILPVRTDFSDPVKRFGTSGEDALFGGRGNDSFKGGGGNDSIDGGMGVDSAVFGTSSFNYVISRATGSGPFSVRDKTGVDGIDTLTGIERIVFSDKRLAIDLDGNAGQVVKILGAVFGAATVANKSYVGIGLSYIDTGMSYTDLMQLAIDARLGGRGSNADVVSLLYTNVVGSAPDAGSLTFYKTLLDNGTYTQGSLGVLAADTSINTANINLVGLALTGVEFI